MSNNVLKMLHPFTFHEKKKTILNQRKKLPKYQHCVRGKMKWESVQRDFQSRGEKMITIMILMMIMIK